MNRVAYQWTWIKGGGAGRRSRSGRFGNIRSVIELDGYASLYIIFSTIVGSPLGFRSAEFSDTSRQIYKSCSAVGSIVEDALAIASRNPSSLR